MVDYSQYSDDELIEMVRSGKEDVTDFILDKYKSMVKRRARAMFLIGGETDDLIQEGMIGLFKSIRDYDASKGIPFSNFAEICVSRQIYTAVASSNRKKHKPLNTYISLSNDDNQMGEYIQLEDMLGTMITNNPEEVVIAREVLSDKINKIKERLSSFEKEVLNLFLEGSDYLEIGAKLGKSGKSIDNALQRIKQKIQEK